MNRTERWPKTAPADHVYLSYAYLNARDYDALASLLDADVVFRGPEGVVASGREDVIAAEKRRRFVYTLDEIWSAAGRMVVTGILRQPEPGCPEVDFAAIFVMSECGLIVSRRTYVSGIIPDEADTGTGTGRIVSMEA
ncbi:MULTISPECIES: nuclear transport factor 2 family protein [unclassified Streptomyces]|uniref:nuclear transport factor 2 family protein n=1 Tax=unclassified Streptomyces TaxID=2593676 RepID=UPI0037F6E4CF